MMSSDTTASGPNTPGISTTGLRVFVVEDEALISMLMEYYLEELGCKIVATASRLPDALEKAATLEADVVVLDVNLAGQLSYPVAEVLMARSIPIVFATGYGNGGLPPALKGLTLLVKPFTEDQFAAALRAATANH